MCFGPPTLIYDADNDDDDADSTLPVILRSLGVNTDT